MKIRINRKVFKIIGILTGVLLLGVLLFTLLSFWENRHGSVEIFGGDDDDRLYLNGVCYVPNNNLEKILLIGVDKYGTQIQGESYNNDQQADFLMLLLMDKKEGTCTGLHLNRDTITEIPVLGVRGEKAGAVTGQLALAHTYGEGGHDSCRNTVEAVSNLLYGVDIDHYIAFTMDAVKRVNDSVGGVTVKLSDDLTSVSPDMRMGATLTLKGDKALAYVRARYGLEDSSNLRRMERQRQYLSELRKLLYEKAEADDTFFLNILDTISECMTSDCTINQLSRMYDQWKLCEDGGFETLEGEAKKGTEFIEFYPDEAALKKQVAHLFYLPLEEQRP